MNSDQVSDLSIVVHGGRSTATGARECARVPCTLNRERLRSDPTSVRHRSFRWRIHKPHPTDTAVRVPRAPDCRHTFDHSHTRPQSPPSVIAEHARPTTPLLWVPPTPHTPHALACSPPPGVLSLASCVRIRRAANAKPLSYSEHSRSRSAADRMPPPRPLACHMMNVPKTIDIHTWSA